MKRCDKILFFGTFLIAFLLFLMMNGDGENQGNRLVIKINGDIYGTYDLAEDQVVEIEVGEFHNKLSISEGKVSMDEADCPDKYCVHHDEIWKENQTIVCLPHKLVAEIDWTDGENMAENVDAVAE